MRKVGNLYLPGDSGYDPEEHKKYTWNTVRQWAGLKPTEGADIEVLGFYVRDNRTNPPTAICKNCKFPIISNLDAERMGIKPPQIKDPPVFFQYAGEAFSFIKGMNLSEDEERKMTIVALAPAPDSLGDAMPTHIFMDNKELKDR